MHLVINQPTDRIELVTGACIDKLYNLSKSDTLDSTSYLRGSINAASAYEDAVTFLNTMWGPNLIVTAGAYYIRFADPNILSVLLNAGIGDGNGISTSDAASANITNTFKNNTNIVSFNEFSYFTSQHGRDTSFEGCTNLERIDISNCSKLPVFTGDNNLEYYNGSSSVQGTCIIPDGVTEIKANGFQNNYKLTAVYIPSSITKMNNGSFTNDSSLQAVHITDLDAWCRINFTFTNSNPLYVGAHKLYINGTQATFIDIPSTITTLLQYVFRNFETMQQVTIPSSITEIKADAFEGCTGLQRVDITDLDAWMDITFGNENANPLKNAHNLYLNDNLVTSVDFTGKTNVKNYVFEGATCLTSVVLPSTIVSIGLNAFDGCTNLVIQDLNLHNLTTLGSRAFQGTKVQTVSDLGSVTSIPNSCFENCSQLTTINLNNITSIGNGAFSNCHNLVYFHGAGSVAGELNLSNITELPDYVFSGCDALTSIVIPNTVTKIGTSAFGNIRKTLHQNLVIPSSVTSIGWGAFNATTFDSVTIMATVPPTLVASNSFGQSMQYPIYVPAGSVSAYQSASGWSSLAGRIQAIPNS